jgi:DNA-binding MarR family transcriptional regulator
VTAPARSDHDELAGEVWRRLTEVTFRQRRYFVSAAASFGLNPGALKALLELDVDHPVSMGALAEAWGYDASTITWLVDQLEHRGLVERRVLPHDRRVKTVVVTGAGVELRENVEAHLRLAPAELLRLDDVDLELLARVLDKVAAAAR